MEKALELFAEKGFESTSVQEITDECGMSKGAFYLSFNSKDELILSLIDHFMMQVISDIDYIVKSTKDDENLLYEFYYTIFNTFQKHSNFAKIFVKEQMQYFNEDLMIKGRFYDQTLDKIISSIAERLYGETISHIKHDLIYCIKGFMKTYAELFIFYNLPLDLDILAKSLVDKTNILAKHSTVPFITPELVQLQQQSATGDLTKEQLLQIIEQNIEEIEEETEKESLILLKQQVIEPTLSPVLVKGLLENIRTHPHCKWVSYLLRNYLKIN